jgi:hypothetical protein
MDVYSGPYGWDDSTGKALSAKDTLSLNSSEQQPPPEIVTQFTPPDELMDIKLPAAAESTGISKPLIQVVQAKPSFTVHEDRSNFTLRITLEGIVIHLT